VFSRKKMTQRKSHLANEIADL